MRVADNVPDFFIGGRGKRKSLEALVHRPGVVWTESTLAKAGGIGGNRSGRRQFKALRKAGLLVPVDTERIPVRGGHVLNETHGLVEPLRKLLPVLADTNVVPDVPISD